MLTTLRLAILTNPQWQNCVINSKLPQNALQIPTAISHLGYSYSNLNSPPRQMLKFIQIVSCLLLLLYGPISKGQPADTAAQDEIQLLIDVSGSMKENDPGNLRIAASQLFISLLPEQAKVSIWLFAEKTTQLIETNSVNAAWKQQALQACKKIHSKGLYTHIENAIETTLTQGFKGNGRKHLLLLTDGLVDISKDIMVSADSRERIFSEWIPRLQQQAIKVETIGLSGQVDKELLEKLASDTGGWNENPQVAEQLQRVFLKMLLKAVPKENLPLTGNQFTVDSQVKEFSVLAFKANDSAASKLVTPDKKQIDKRSAPANVAWLENPGFDLITVKQPGVGDWRLDADVDHDNQVMIITDLKMQLAEFDSFLQDKQQLELKVHFTDQDKLITRADFLAVLTISAALDQQAPQNFQPIEADPGNFSYKLENLSPGKHQLKVVADGKTFKREISRDFQVLAAPVRLETEATPGKREMLLKLIPEQGMVQPGSLGGEVLIHESGKSDRTEVIHADSNGWSLKLANLTAGAETTVSFRLQAKNQDGKPIMPEIKPLTITDQDFSVNAGHVENEAKATAETEHPIHAEEPESKPDEEHEAGTNWFKVSAIVLGVNFLLLFSGYYLLRALKKARIAKQQRILENLS